MTVLPNGSNHIPTYSPISNLPLTASLSGPDTIFACANTPLCFDVSASDQDSAQGLLMFWDGHIPGATFTDANNAAVQDSITDAAPAAQFCWNNPVAGTHQFLLQTNDDACPIYGSADRVITIVVGNEVPLPNLISNSNTLNTCVGMADSLFALPGYSSYSWSNGATGNSTLVFQPGTYSVTATSGACLVTDSFVVLPSTPADLSGTILDHNSLPLANTRVQLFRLNPSDSSLTPRDFTFTDSVGYYKFCALSEDSLYVQVRPDLNVPIPQEMLTYANATMYWNQAVPIFTANFPASVNFSSLPFANLAGQCAITGNISQLTSGGPAAVNIPVILRDNNNGVAVGYALTDATGAFAFTNLTAGTFAVSVDKPFVDEVNVPIISLTNANCSQTGLDLILHPTFLEVAPVATDENMPEASFRLIPNPANAATRLEFSLLAPDEVAVQVLSLQGKMLFEMAHGTLRAGTHQLNLKTAALPAGTYWLVLRAGTQRRVQKLVVMH